MKRFRVIMILTLLTATFCTHPYEEGMIGSFPYFEVKDPVSFTFDAVSSGEMKGEVSFATNMTVSASVSYSDSKAAGWIMDVHAVPVGEGGNVLSFTVTENLKRAPRSAKITVLADGRSSGCVIDVYQDAYQITGETMVYEGSMILKTREDVENCIYTDITGDFVINGDEIRDLSSLSHVVNVGGSLVIDDCDRLLSLGPVGKLDVHQLVLTRAHAGRLLTGFSGSVEALTVEAPYEQPFYLNLLDDFGSLASLILKGVHVSNLYPVLDIPALEYLQVTESPISEPELCYIEALRPGLTVESSDLADDSSISVSVSDNVSGTQSFGMSLHISGYPALDEVGYILQPSDSEFDFEERSVLDEWYYADSEFSVTGLSSGQEYVIRTYACGTDGRIYLSKPLTFSIEP